MKNFINTIRGKHNAIYRAILFILTIIIIISFFPKQGKFKYEFQLGKHWLNEELSAPFDFPILKSKEELETEKNKIISEAHPYLRKDSSILVKKQNSFKEDFLKKWETSGNKQFDKQLTMGYGISILSSIYKTGVVEITESLEKKEKDQLVMVVNGNQATESELNKIYTLQKAYDFLVDTLKQSSAKVDRDLLASILDNYITHNLFNDDELAEKFYKEQVANISLTHDLMKKGEHIISKGEVVDKNKYQILESLKNEFIAQYASKNNYAWITSGFALLVGICLSLLFSFLLLFRKDMLEDNVKITFMFFVISLNIVMLSLALRFDIINLYLLPFCILPVITRVFFDTRTALFTHLMCCLIMGFIVPNPFEFILLEFIAGIVSIFSIISMRNRSQLFITVGLVYITYCLTFFGINIIQEGKPENIDWTYFGWFGISSMITLFAYPLIYIFEKSFGFVSEVSLLELADTNSPLLRELALKAPGTFQHSLQVANLAEDAVRQIGGSPLLVRTGALYHDIGKMDSPVYFIENQSGGINPHNDISADESAHIIIDHVLKGIEKAKKANVPDQIIDFIRTHHGSLKVEYFYKHFIMQNPEEQVDISMFQYPGPIPFSKETAVLMMADSVEAASRSLKKYDSESIHNLVERIINHQIEENQFVNSDITFRDINIIKKMFKKKLLNIYHLRIEYPS